MRWMTLVFALAVSHGLATPARAQCQVEQDMLVYSDVPDTRFGCSVSLSGGTAVIGAENADVGGFFSAGRAFVFELSPQAGWVLARELVSSTPSSLFQFGESVSVAGNTAVVGSPKDSLIGSWNGAVHLFERDQGGPGAWDEAIKLTAPDGTQWDLFGNAVSVSGDTLVVGAYNEDLGASNSTNEGAAYVFERNLGGAGAWGLAAKLTPCVPVVGGWFGYAVAVQGDTIVVGAPAIPKQIPGRACVFERGTAGGGAWTEVAQLTQGVAQDAFGYSLAVDGDLIVVGVPSPSLFTDVDSAIVYGRDQGGAGAWGALQTLLSPGNAAAGFGWSVAVQGDSILVGSPGDQPNGIPSGAAYAFERDASAGGLWGAPQLLAPSVFPPTLSYSARFGSAVSAGAGRSLIGAFQAWGFAGAAFVFDWAGDTGASYCTAGTSASGCEGLLAACGTPSASAASGFELRATNVEGDVPGLFFFGVHGQQAVPWGNSGSYQCLVPPVSRGTLLDTGGSHGACDGSALFDLAAHWTAKPSQSPAAGTAVQTQFWYRDAASTSNETTALSNALEFVVAP